ncbi:MAG: right-handed parallel beta-helix repeat-containing protein [Candidatus Handelsmanbacteria bacterium]|nr:right-handed parallel beta-helix repeat-containing protein [Candidatus Handelsmanbacteria bacterium]
MKHPLLLLALLLGAAPASSQWQCRDAPAAKPALTRGSLSALVIFAKFRGEALGDTLAPPWAADLFDPERPGSFSHFYREMSRGKMQVSGQSLPRRYSSTEPAAAYVARSSGVLGDYGRFNLQILAQADNDADFGQFDNDGPDGIPNSGDDDGYVDVVFINLLTVPRNFFISGATGFASLGLDGDYLSGDPAEGGGVIRVRSRFSGFGGTTQRAHIFSIAAGSMCHEFGHVLGLPDLFDQSTVTAAGEVKPAEDSAGVGKWCLMTSTGARGWGVEDGPNAFSAWALAKLGWVEVVALTEDQPDLAIEDLALGHQVYKLPVSAEEYFLIENRRRASSFYNRNIPGEGLLVWHVDDRADNDEERHPQVDLLCADGLRDEQGNPDPVDGRDDLDFWANDETYAAAHGGNEGDATDPFDGVRFTRLAWDTNPALSAHTGFRRNLPLGMAIENIRREGTHMRCSVRLRQNLPGHVAADTTWAGEVHLSGDVVVEPGATLTLAQGARLRFVRGDDQGSGFDPNRAEVLVYGGLRLEGRARCESAAATPRADDWAGVFLMDGQALDAEQLQLDHALHGLVQARLPQGLTRWSGTRRLPWDVVVPAGAELIVAPGARVLFAPQDLSGSGLSPELVELAVEGRFRAEGGAFAVDPARSQDLWFGVRLAPGAQVEVRDATIDRCVYGFSGEVSAGGSFTLEDSRIQQSLGGLSLTLQGPALVSGTSFFHLTIPAIRAQGGSRLTLRGVTVEQCGQEGVSLGNASLEAVDLRLEQNGLLDAQDPRPGLKAVGGRGQRLELSKSTSTRNTGGGLDLEGWEGEVVVRQSQLSANQGVGLRARSPQRLSLEEVRLENNQGDGAVVAGVPLVEVQGSTFADNIGTGLVLSEGAAGTIAASRFLNNAGLRFEDIPRFAVRASTFANAGVGFESRSSAPALEGSTFQGNLTALKASGSPLPTLSGNTFRDNRTAVENLSGQALPAGGNYWGSADSAAIAALFQGPVDWRPFLGAAPADTAAEGGGTLPTRAALFPAFPNPFNGATTLRFDLPADTRATLTICDALGRPLRRLLDAPLAAGTHRYTWDGRDDQGQEVASGVFLARLRAGEFRAVVRVAVVR